MKSFTTTLFTVIALFGLMVSNNVDAQSTPSLTGSFCTILEGQSTCRLLDLKVKNPVSTFYDLYNKKSLITTSNAFYSPAYSYNGGVGETAAVIGYGSTYLSLRESRKQDDLFLLNVTGSCTTGTSWVDNKCSKTVPKTLTHEELLKRIQELLLLIEELKARMSIGVSASGDVFIEPIAPGLTNKSVELLQKVLATDPSVYPKGLITGYFGDLTKEALMNFQVKYKLPVTGTFTGDTESILTTVLLAIPYATYPSDYLLQLDVNSKIQSAVAGEAPADLVSGGKVILSANPVFSEVSATSDTATVQRILKTDYFLSSGVLINGLMDTATVKAIVSLRIKYGIPYKVPASGKVVVTDLMNPQTVDLFRKMLVVNNAPTIKPGLLLMSEVAPSKLINNSSRTLTKIRATRDYRNNNTSVYVTYEGGATEGFVIPTVSPNDAVATAIATKLGRSVASVTAVITHDSIYGNDFETILLTIDLSTKMDIDVTYKDGTKEFIPITSSEIDVFVDRVYGGDFAWYKRDFDMYVEKARRGENVEIVYDMVAGVLGVTRSEVKAVLKINVEEYNKSDPCWDGDVWICHGS